MNLFDMMAILLSVAAIFSYINHRYFKLPSAIGLILLAIGMSIVMIILNVMGFPTRDLAGKFLDHIDFSSTLMHGMLSFLLFAGALHINLEDLLSVKWVVSFLATAGVLGCTLITGVLMYLIFLWLSIPVPLIYCFLFGALISPTDPIAVLGILKRMKIPKSLETKIAGESLFNDGMGIVLFIVLLQIATSGNHFGFASMVLLFVKEVLGGLLLGITVGWLVYRMMKSINQYQVEILLTLALVSGAYALALKIHISGPIASVVSGLLIGNHGRRFAMSDQTRLHLDLFWELVDEILNAVLFVLIGMEILIVPFQYQYLIAGTMAILIVLFARWVSVGSAVFLLGFVRDFSKNAITVLTWGGLRGGLSVAMVLSLPGGPVRDVLLSVTYSVVVFSLVVQGLTIQRVISR
ncbi:MAG: sodium:proton antiporter [Chlamydiota bacterium]|nr:sodium:proton antiporter [Chlamydiota bacterium]